MKPKIILLDKTFQKISYWVRRSPVEISGLGVVELRDNAFVITDALLLPQKNGAAHTDIEAEDVCKLMYQRRNQPGELQYWWHSHADMGVFWSGTDMATMEALSAGGYFLNTVFNKKGERRSAIMLGKPCLVFVDEIETVVERRLTEEFMKEMDTEYDLNIKKEEERVPYSWTPKGNGQQTEFSPLYKGRGRRKPRGYKKNGRYFFVGSGIETVEEGVDVPEHLDFDSELNKYPIVDTRRDFRSDREDDDGGAVAEREDKIQALMKTYNCDYTNAEMMLDHEEDIRGAQC